MLKNAHLLTINDHRTRDLCLDLEKSQGSYLHDANTGRTFFDAFTFWSSLPLGYRHPIFERQETQKELLAAATYKMPSGRIYSPMFESFLEAFHQFAGPELWSNYYFIHGGTLAVENALKTAFDYKRAVSGKAAEEMEIIAFEQAFHGCAGFALSLTHVPPYKIGDLPKHPWRRFSTPAVRHPLDAEEVARLDELEPQITDQIEGYIEARGRDRIAGILIEPIQGGGGDHHFRDSFLQRLRVLCDHHQIALIFDEVQTGFGATGKNWCFEHFGVQPDILVFGKKSQISGIAVHPKVAEVAGTFKVPGRLDVTWNGNIVDMVRCKYVIQAYGEGQLVENAKTRGEQILRDLQTLPGLQNVRGRGLIIAFDLPTQAQRDAFCSVAFDQGLLTSPNGVASVRLRFNMAVTKTEADDFNQRVKAALSIC